MPRAGDIYIADMGYQGKTRPVVVITEVKSSDARDLTTVIPLTSSMRGGPEEVDIGKLRALPRRCAANVAGVSSLRTSALTRRVTTLDDSTFSEIMDALRAHLGL
jgi:mRNA interferase MazF